MTTTLKKFPKRIILYTVLTHFFAFLGIYLKQVQNIQGAELIFLCLPLILAFIFSARDKNIQLGKSLRIFKLKTAWRWYLFAIVIYPITFLIATVFGQSTGLLTTSNWQGYPMFVLMALPTALIFAFFEEFAWRGYLEPLLEKRGFSQVIASLIVGIIWVTWHIPLFVYKYYDIYGTAPVRSFILFAITLLITAQVYGIMRRWSQTVWTSVLIHGIGNAFALPLIIGENAIWTSYSFEWLILPTPSSILSLILWGIILFLVLKVTKKV